MPNSPPRWLDADAAARHLGLRVDAFLCRLKAEKLPAPTYMLGARTPRWDREALDAAMEGGRGATSHGRPFSKVVEATLAEGRKKQARREQANGGQPGVRMKAGAPAPKGTGA